MTVGQPHATRQQLADWLAVPLGSLEVDDETAADTDRTLRRASELIDEHVVSVYAVNTTTGLATDPDEAQALADAVCAQIEFWREVREVHDVEGLAGTQVSSGGVTQQLAPTLAPRARRALSRGGLLSPRRGRWWDRFYLFENG